MKAHFFFIIYLSFLTFLAFLSISCEKRPQFSSNASRFIASKHLLKLDKHEELDAGVKFFLHEEQTLRPKSLRNDKAISKKVNTEFYPENNPKFPLPYFLIPETDIILLASDSLDSKILDQLSMKISGLRHLKFFIHPEFEEYYNFLRSAYNYVSSDNTEFFSSPTSSYGSLVVWNRNNPDDKPFIAIVSLDQANLQNKPNIKISDIDVAITNQEIQDQNSKSVLKDISIKIFPTTLGFAITKVHPKSFLKFTGQLIREIPDNVSSGQFQWHSLSVLLGTSEENEAIIMSIIKKSRLSSYDFLKKYFIDGYLDLFEELSLKNGISLEPYPQNLIFETNNQLEPTGKWIFRNFVDYWPLEENKKELKKYKLKKFAEKSNPIKSYVFFYKKQIFDKLLEFVAEHDSALGTKEIVSLKALIDERYKKLINTYLGLNLKTAPTMDNYKKIEEVIKNRAD